jgi:hypothetical protein
MSTVTAPARRATAVKLDLKAQLKPLYTAAVGETKSIDPGEQHYLMIDGKGDPNTSPAFQTAVEVLFSVSYHLKFSMKKSTGVDYGVMPLEGLWWAEDMSTFSVQDKTNWLWTMMILQPAFMTQEMFEASRRAVADKKKLPVEALRYELLAEGTCAQIMHVGPFATEPATIQALHQWIEAAGKHRTGKHHEIYLNDFRRTAPARLKTILRQPYG